MALTLKKLESVAWRGNGFGQDSAAWVVKGFEHIEVIQLGGQWRAIDRSAAGVKYIARGATRAECVEQLERKLES